MRRSTSPFYENQHAIIQGKFLPPKNETLALDICTEKAGFTIHSWLSELIHWDAMAYQARNAFGWVGWVDTGDQDSYHVTFCSIQVHLISAKYLSEVRVDMNFLHPFGRTVICFDRRSLQHGSVFRDFITCQVEHWTQAVFLERLTEEAILYICIISY